ncbi:MAG TPA: hypothetical protein VFV93_11950, partial [Thermomicrobiales bacterium]|nr:hypothetical protein [Thermomicrobiales bacterium]
MTERTAHRRRRPIGRIGLLLALLPLLLFGCSTSGGESSTPTPTATATSSPTPEPTSTPTATPSPTAFVPPTVAVEDDDSIQACMERNLTPELLISLSKDDTSLTEDIMRTCLETTIPSPLMFLLNPIIDDASECALDVSKTLSN